LILDEDDSFVLLPSVRVQLNILHDAKAIRGEKHRGATDIDFIPLQHPDHPVPGSVLHAIAPGICNVEAYPGK